jgi:sugar phosphate isomerase/epimerase
MKLSHGLHLAYCTNIHRGQTWVETWEALKRYTLAVRDRVSPKAPYAIGLRLSDQASRELSDSKQLLAFQSWLEKENCYVFTINGFPYGQFHGTRVKEQVYAPDWTTRERLEYTCRLFDLLDALRPEGVEGSVSTVPCSYKEFIHSTAQDKAMRDNLWRCIEHIAGKSLHLGLEPEPLCYVETSQETVEFIERMRGDRPGDDRLDRHLGVNYDTCHLAVEFEEPADVLRRFKEHKVRISKLHLSSALKVQANAATRTALRAFADDTYFHQVIERAPDGTLKRYKDLDVAFAQAGENEWRIHFHVPLHSPPTKLFGNTADHLMGVLDALKDDPKLCSHLEMETYTWEVMPAEMKKRDVVDQLAGEYDWTLKHLADRGFTRAE